MSDNIRGKLDKRLSLAASFVRNGSRVADIGTDHAYLPVWLVQNGVCPFAIAADIRSGPAERAAESVKKAGLESKISVRLGDGLSPVNPSEADDIVIAGMGGETIADILNGTPWTKDARYHLVLQPMTRAAALHESLLSNGYAITREQTVTDGKRVYLVLAARFDPVAAAGQAGQPAAFIRGALDIERDRFYLEKQKNRLLKEASALKKSGETDQAEKLILLAESLFDI